jgi:hypothetical protein
MMLSSRDDHAKALHRRDDPKNQKGPGNQGCATALQGHFQGKQAGTID